MQGCACCGHDHPFIVLTETKFSFRCIPVGSVLSLPDYSPYRTRVEKKKNVMMLLGELGTQSPPLSVHAHHWHEWREYEGKTLCLSECHCFLVHRLTLHAPRE
jgi:hypothetical protein